MALFDISLVNSTCTRKLTESHQTLPSLCVILKAIHAGVGWVWLARLGFSSFVASTSFLIKGSESRLQGYTVVYVWKEVGKEEWVRTYRDT